MSGRRRYKRLVEAGGVRRREGVGREALGRGIWAGFIKDYSTPAESGPYTSADQGFCLFVRWFISFVGLLFKETSLWQLF